MKSLTQHYDVVVAGGGLAGFSAAVAAARQGARTCLVQDRPVLGGNSSSEVRVTPHGAAGFHAYARETGIISEALIEERARNHETIFENGWTNSVWDLVLYDMAKTTPNLTLCVNTSIVAVVSGGVRVEQTPSADAGFGFFHRPACNHCRRLDALIGRVANAELELTLTGSYFIDCTGDGVIADLAGCEWRMGSEGRGEFNEPHAPEKPSRDTMGNSIHFRARDVGRPAPFAPPLWAIKYENADFFYKQGRIPKLNPGGYWWLEIGVPWDTIHDAEDIRHELTRHTLGVWDWIKNRDPQTQEFAMNLALDWIGQVPGKRESRRIMGRQFVTENDIHDRVVFRDEIAFGGWYLDLHTPGGLLAKSSEPSSAEGYKPTATYSRKSFVGPYGLPLGMLISKDMDNLMMAGRNVSVTRAALGTVRVMGTTALLGQAAGTAAARSLVVSRDPFQFSADDVAAIQQQLLRDGCFLPNRGNQDPADVARLAKPSTSSEATAQGASLEDTAYTDGLSYWRDQAVSTGKDELYKRRGQWIAVAGGKLERIEFYLTNLTDRPQQVSAWLQVVEGIWDYRVETTRLLQEGQLTIPAGGSHWIPWLIAADIPAAGYVRVDLGANEYVCWHVANAILPGHTSAFDIGEGRMRRYSSGVTMAFRVHPPQPVYAAANVLSGVTRPHRTTNLWRSDPAQALPQWLELAWAEPQPIAIVEITFPGHLIREYHAYGSFYRDPQCPRDYRIEGLVGVGWRELVTISGNYQRHRRHVLPQPTIVSAIRIVVVATNGDPAAAIYEVRAYV